MVIKLTFHRDVQVLGCHIQPATTSQSQLYKRKIGHLQLQTRAINLFLMVASILKQTSSHLNKDKMLNFFLQVKTNSLGSSILKVEQSHSLKQKAFTIHRYVGKQASIITWMSITASKVNMRLIQDHLG